MRLCILGAYYDVILEELAEGLEGECRHADAAIAVNSKISPRRRWVVLRHEAGHGAFYESGCRAVLRTAGLTEEQADAIEELIMETFVPAYCDTLERIGWLQPPSIQ